MRLRTLFAAALCAGSALAAGPAMAQDDVLVAIHTEKRVDFIPLSIVDEFVGVGREAAIMPVPEAQLWLTVTRYGFEPGPMPRTMRATTASLEYGDFAETPARLPMRCIESVYFCAGVVPNYELSRESSSWQPGDPIELLPTEAVGGIIRLPFF